MSFWICKKQTAVSHSSTEAEIIALDATIRMEGIPALLLWDLVKEIVCDKTKSPPYMSNKTDIADIDYVPPSLKKHQAVEPAFTYLKITKPF